MIADHDLSLLESILEKHRDAERSGLLPALHDAQAIYGWLPPVVLEAIGRGLRVPLADVHGVVEFYTMFYSEPVGRGIVRICTDPACALAGADDALAAACRRSEEHTSELQSPTNLVCRLLLEK